MNKLDKHPCIKLDVDDFQVEFDIEYLPCDDYIENEIKNIGNQIDRNDEKIEILNKEIERLTNDADSLDYNVAVGSGVIAGLIDSFFVGEFDILRGRKWGEEQINDFVKKIAKLKGYDKNDLSGSIKHLENNFPFVGDGNTPDFGGGLQHHLRDFSHHPNAIGLLFSLLTQFTEKSYGTDTDGNFIIVDIKDSHRYLIGKDLIEKISFGIIKWFFHLVSDMAGSSSTPGAGTGLPGPILSLAKQLSSLPIFKDSKIGNENIRLIISKLFNGTYIMSRDDQGKIIQESRIRFDLRTEIGLLKELGRQSLPVIINEVIVRSFYFIRRLVAELREKSDLDLVDWKKVLPFNNRTIARMLTISTGTFMMVDLADATIRGAIKSKGNKVLFAKEFLLRVNFVGIGRFVIAVGTDIGMGIKREKMLNERIKIMSNQLHLMNAKTFYYQANMWKNAISTAETIEEVKEIMQNSYFFTIKTWEENKISLENIGNDIEVIKKKDPKLIKDLLDTLKWH